MALPSLKQVLMDRDGLTEREALDLIDECRREIALVESYDEAESIYEDYFGLEPDWLDEILF